MGLKLSEFSRMPATQRNEALTTMAKSAQKPRNGQARRVEDRVRVYEAKFKMSSAEMRVKLKRGELEDTAELAAWLVLLSTLDGR